MGKIINLIGQKFGKLTVIKYDGANKKRKTSMWLCKCECGNEKVIATHDLRHGTISCGCLSEENKIKFKAKYRKGVETKERRIRSIYQGMYRRCYKKESNRYKNYGARGIKIYKKWLEDYFEFEKWAMENGYKADLTIDRKDVTGDYEPSNCRWISNKRQQNNRTNNHFLEIDGVEHTIAEWSEIYNIKQNTILYRLKRGWDVKKAVQTSSKK